MKSRSRIELAFALCLAAGSPAAAGDGAITEANPNVPAFRKGSLVIPCGYSGLLLEKPAAKAAGPSAGGAAP